MCTRLILKFSGEPFCLFNSLARRVYWLSFIWWSRFHIANLLVLRYSVRYYRIVMESDTVGDMDFRIATDAALPCQ